MCINSLNTAYLLLIIYFYTLSKKKIVNNSPKNYLIEDSGNNNINLRQDFLVLTFVEIRGNNNI